MFKRAIGIVVLAMVMVGVSWGQETCISSGRKVATTQHNSITTATSRLCGVVIETDGTNAATVIVYDKAATDCDSGTVLFKMIVVGADYRGGTIFPLPVKALNGICLNIAGTGAAAEVYYTK